MKNTNLFYYILTILTIISCQGNQGIEGDPGKNSLTNLIAEPSGTNCENGGVRIDLGLDTDNNNLLDANEVLTSNYICNGLNGLTSLTNVTIEPAGLNCSNGGFRINSGLDINFNGNLEENEVTANAFICNGLDGNNTLIRTTNEPSGDNCSNGGIHIDSGVDSNSDGILNDDEINSTAFLCNGEDGHLSLINVSEVPASSDCPNGGAILDSGIDSNGNNVLEDSEILTTRNICNGTDGKFNEEIRVVFLSSTVGSSSGTSGLEGHILSTLQRFDIRRYGLLNTATFITRSWTEDQSNTAIIELINGNTDEIIPNSTLTTNFSGSSGKILISPNIYENFPKEEITLSLRIRSQNERVAVYINGRSELILNRGN